MKFHNGEEPKEVLIKVPFYKDELTTHSDAFLYILKRLIKLKLTPVAGFKIEKVDEQFHYSFLAISDSEENRQLAAAVKYDKQL